MKQSIFVCLFLFVAVCHAQRIDPVIVLQDGSWVDCSHKFIDGESATFRLKNGTVDNIRWTFNIFGKNGESVQVLQSDYGSDCFTFKVTPDLLSMPAYDCKQVDSKDDLSVYIKGSVYLYKDETAVDSFPVWLNVLPSRPVVKTASLDGEFNYQYLGYYPLATAEIVFASDRMERCRLCKYVSDSLLAFQFPLNYTLVYSAELNYEKIDEFYKVKYQYADCGEFYQLFCWNKYGSVSGVDTISTNDLIQDREVLDFIETFRYGASVYDVIEEDFRVIYYNNTLIIEGNSCSSEITIYSSDGQLKYKSDRDNRVNVSFLERGVYIVKIKSKKDKITIKKIIKS